MKFPPEFIRNDGRYFEINNLKKNPYFFNNYYYLFVKPVSFFLPRYKNELIFPVNTYPVKSLEKNLFVIGGYVKDVSSVSMDYQIKVLLNDNKESTYIFKSKKSMYLGVSGHSSNEMDIDFEKLHVFNLKVGDRVNIVQKDLENNEIDYLFKLP
jgi:hypothetical protein